MTIVQGDAIKVVIVDDHALVRAGLRMLIDNEPDMRVVGEAGSCEEGISVVECEQPDVIILDLDIGGESSLDRISDILAASGKSRVLILTGMRDAEAHARAAQLGASGLVLKEKAADVLIKAVRCVHAGEIWFDRTMINSLVLEMTRRDAEKSNPEAAKIATLTERERQIITLLGEGLKNKFIAARLFISETTVRHHLTSIYSKLAITDRLELLIYAHRHGLITPPEPPAK
jgi:DNA-binding NarL/FixJ family response regulator